MRAKRKPPSGRGYYTPEPPPIAGTDILVELEGAIRHIPQGERIAPELYEVIKQHPGFCKNRKNQVHPKTQDERNAELIAEIYPNLGKQKKRGRRK